MAIPRADAALLLRRAGFGGTLAEIDDLATAATWADAVERVLDTSAAPPVVPPAELTDPAKDAYTRWVACTQWWIERMRTTPAPIVEKLTLFWHGHFASSTDKVPIELLFDQIDLYRQRALGDFHDLAQAMAVHPAMLVYLDNATNVAGVENENFARELMEMFTMGNHTFGEADVIAMARAWTGHGLDRAGTSYEFHPDRHDAGDKTLFGITRAWNGPETITEIIRGSKRFVSARFIAAELWSFLATPDPSATIVADLAKAFGAARQDLKALVRAIFLHPEFRSPAVRGGLVRSPIEWIVLILRSLGISAADAHPDWFVGAMGHVPFAPPNVSGWKPNAYWISTSGLWARGSFAGYVRWLATDDSGPYRLFADLPAKTPAEIAGTLLATFGIESPSPRTRTIVTNWANGLKQPGAPSWSIRPNGIPLVALSPEALLA
ncbi:MAG: DUF1800 domain-containing protein [Actinobacteria bacterium]|nr:DUF1800 domain-containing protein [Actinomycetota bacterium]